jgi:hypothetical protein
MKWRPKGLIISKGQRPQQRWGPTFFIAPCHTTQMGKRAHKIKNLKKTLIFKNLEKF